MSSLATVILAWSGVYLYVTLYYGLLWLRRRHDREYLTFSLLSLGLAMYSISQVFLEDAQDVDEVHLATRLGAVGLLTTLPFLVDFTSSLMGSQTRLTFTTYIWSALGLLGVGAGLFFDVDAEVGPPWFRLVERHAPNPTPTTWVANLWIVSGIGIAGAAMAILLGRVRRSGLTPTARRDYRLILVSLGLSVAAGAHDALVRAGRIESVELLVHVALLFMVVMTYILLDRFVAASRALIRRTVELNGSYEALQRTQRELVLKEQLAAVGELSAVIAHEVRNPLAVIRNAGAGLRRSNVDEMDRITLLDILDEETERLNRLVHDLLAYASPVTPRGKRLEIEPLLKHVVERVLSGMRANADLADISVEYAFDGPETLFGDAELLRHALVNVIENALQSMEDGGTLTITSAIATLNGDSAVRISFVDNGEGMDLDTRNKATHPFFTTRPSGTGLGLAIVERVLRNHGGEIEIESEPGVGTTLSFILPVRGAQGALPPSGGRERKLTPLGDVS